MEENKSSSIAEILRNSCPACASKSRRDFQICKKNVRLPILPICVDTEKDKDILFPINLVVCNDCGLLYLSTVVNPGDLYGIFHSEAIGRVWEEEFDKFSKIIKSNMSGGKILEVGAGTGQLIKRLIKSNFDIYAIDPSYSGPTDNVKVFKELFDGNFADKFSGEFDAVISEHSIEHFLEFQEYFKNARKVLKQGGMMFTSVPNQEFSFSQGQTNQINLEHTALCTNLHWIYLHLKHGFLIEKISFHKGHSIQIVARKIEEPQNIELNTQEMSVAMLNNFEKLIKDKLDRVRTNVLPDKENWIFGAANTTQWLFALGLDESSFEGILDNSEIKKNKRLYGTNLIVRNPGQIIGQTKNKLRIFINLGNYNSEVFKQINELDSEIECILI